MADSVSLKFVYSRREYLAALRAYHRHHLRPRLPLLAAVVGALVVVGVLSLFAFDRRELGLLCLAVAALIPLVALAAVEVLPRLTASRTRGLEDEFRWQFYPDATRLQIGRGESRLPWSGYGRVLENEAFYYLEFSGNVLSVIPKRAFAGPQEESAFRALVRRRVAGGISQM